VDELHDVIGQAVLLADAEHRHNVGVVKLGRRFGLPLEAPLGPGVGQQALGQHLERDVPVEGNLLGLVDDAHTALADFAEDAKIAELLQSRSQRCILLPGGLPVVFLNQLDLDHGREDLADVGCEVRVALDVFGQRGALAPPVALGELVGQPGEQHDVVGAVRGFVRHCRILPAWWRGSP
jgi:hypothetical protein